MEREPSRTRGRDFDEHSPLELPQCRPPGRFHGKRIASRIGESATISEEQMR